MLAILYPNVVIKSLHGNLEICLKYYARAYFQSQHFVCAILVAILTCFLKSHCLVTVLSRNAETVTEDWFIRKKPDDTNALIPEAVLSL